MAQRIRTNKVDWILKCAVRDIGFKTALKDLNEQEIKHCLGIEKRVSAIEALRREARRKGITIEEPAGVKCPGCGWSGQAKDWEAIVCPRCGKWVKVEKESAAAR